MDVGAELGGALATGGGASVVGLGVEHPATSNATVSAAKPVEIFIIELGLLQMTAGTFAVVATAWPWNLRSNAFVAKKSQKSV